MPKIFNLRTKDIDEQASLLTNWKQFYDQLSPGSFFGHLDEIYLEDIQLYQEAINVSTYQNCIAWSDSITFTSPIQMEGVGWFAGEVYKKDKLFIINDSDSIELRTPKNLILIACTVDLSVLNKFIETSNLENSDIKWLGDLENPVVLGDAGDFIKNLIMIINNMHQLEHSLKYEAAYNNFKTYLFSQLADLIYSSSKINNKPKIEKRRNSIATKSREYMLSNIDKSITIAELCSEFNISPRTLRYNFKKVYGLSPNKFLRTLRLNNVRRTLQSNAQKQDLNINIGDVAAEWGFWHVSHFIAEYKKLFYELPSETVVRAMKNWS